MDTVSSIELWEKHIMRPRQALVMLYWPVVPATKGASKRPVSSPVTVLAPQPTCYTTQMYVCLHISPAALTHWCRVSHICVSKLTIIGLDNGLSPGRHQAIICTNAGIVLVRTVGMNCSAILSEIHIFQFRKIYLKCLWNGGKFVSASMC